jgi:hypothetical protein
MTMKYMKTIIALALVGASAPALAIPSGVTDVNQQVSMCIRFESDTDGMVAYARASYSESADRLIFMGRCLAHNQGKLDATTKRMGRPFVRLDFNGSDTSYLNMQTGRIWLCRQSLIEALDRGNRTYLEDYFDKPPVTSAEERLEVTATCVAYLSGYKEAL